MFLPVTCDVSLFLFNSTSRSSTQNEYERHVIMWYIFAEISLRKYKFVNRMPHWCSALVTVLRQWIEGRVFDPGVLRSEQLSHIRETISSSSTDIEKWSLRLSPEDLSSYMRHSSHTHAYIRAHTHTHARTHTHTRTGIHIMIVE